MRLRKGSILLDIEFLKSFPMFKRFQTRRENGDVYEESRELTFDEKVVSSQIGYSPDAFADAVERVPDVSLIDRFSAIEQLNAAIAGIEYSPVKSSSDEEK